MGKIVVQQAESIHHPTQADMSNKPVRITEEKERGNGKGIETKATTADIEVEVEVVVEVVEVPRKISPSFIIEMTDMARPLPEILVAIQTKEAKVLADIVIIATRIQEITQKLIKEILKLQ